MSGAYKPKDKTKSLLDKTWAKMHPGWLVVDKDDSITSDRKEQKVKSISNWKEWVPQSGTGAYSRYDTRIVVIISKSGHIYFSQAAYEALNKPDRIVPAFDAMARRVGFRPARALEAGYTVGNASNYPSNKPKGNRHHGGTHSYISCKSFTERVALKRGAVYDAYIEEGYLVIDIDQKASTL